MQQDGVRFSSPVGGTTSRELDNAGYVTVGLDVRAGHLTLAGLADRERLGLITVEREGDLLEIQNDVGGVFGDAINRRELVFDTLDLHSGDRRPLYGRKQRPPDGVADGCAKASLERLRVEFPVAVRQRVGVNVEPARHLKVCPMVILRHIFL